jgi:hypothetical protein
MTQELALASVRKPKAKKTHLTVPTAGDADIRTLCGVEMKAGDYEVVDTPADCQPCLRKRQNRAFISSAYFAQDAGSRLLEMSLEQARWRTGSKSKTGRVKATAAIPAKPAVLAEPAARAAGKAPTKVEAGGDQPSADELRALGLDRLSPAGPDVYRSPGGVLVKVARLGRDWRVTEVVFDGPSQLRSTRRGVSVRLGDLELEIAEPGAGVRVSSSPGRGRT